MSEREEKLQNIIKRFSEVQGISIEEAERIIGAATEEEILNNIKTFTVEKINKNAPPMNRAQRRALAKKMKKDKINTDAQNTIADTAKKLNYINLIQKLRDLNEKRENENYGEKTEKD